MSSPDRFSRRWASVALALLLAAPVGAATQLANIPLAPNGDMLDSGAGKVTVLTSTSFLVHAEGPDGTQGTADDATLFVRDVGGTNQVTVLATPNLTDYGEMVRVSPTRALVISEGADSNSNTADDALLLLDGLGTTNTVTPIPTPFLSGGHARGPLALGPDAALVVSQGPDATSPSADDQVLRITELGAGNVVTPIAAPGIYNFGTRPVGRGPDSFLLTSSGPDFTCCSADDVVYLFENALGTPTRSDLPTPFLGTYAQPTLLSPARMMVNSSGPDGSDSSADDQVYLVDDLGGANTRTPFPTPYLDDYAASRVVAFGPDTAAVRGFGVDTNDQTFDDVMFVFSNLGASNDVEEVGVGPCEEDRECLMMVLDNGAGVIANFGFDLSSDSPDDGISVLFDAGGANTSIYLPLGAMEDRVASQPAPIASDAVMVATGGADGDIGIGADDEYAIVSGLGGALAVEYFPGGEFDNSTGHQFVAQPMGEGRAAHLHSGPDADSGDGSDDSVQVIGDLPADPHLAVTKLKVSANAKGEKLKVTATLPEALADRVGAEDVIVHVGTVSQHIPASAFTAKKNSVSYKDKAEVVSSVKVSLKKGTITLKGKGVGTGLESIDPAYVPVGVQVGDSYQAVAIAGTATSNGVKFKAPKNQ